MAVVNPGKIKSTNEIQGGFTHREETIKQLETQFDEKSISDPLKVAIITSAMPNKVQDRIFSQANTTGRADLTVDQVKD